MTETYDLIFTGGTVVTNGQLRRADLGVRAGKIAAIEDDLSAAQAGRRYDVSGRLVLPEVPRP